MKTLLFATRDAELSPLTGDRCTALLPIAGKPLIVHAVESLAMAAVSDVIVVTRPSQVAELEQELGNGARWGIRIDYFLIDDIEHRLGDRLGNDFLFMRGDILRTPIVSEFLGRARMGEGSRVTATISGVCAGLRFVRRGTLAPLPLTNGPAGLLGRGDDTLTLEFPNARMSLIDSLAAFHRANIDAISGGFPGLVVPGRHLMPGVIVGCKTRLPSQTLNGRPVFVGSRCHISASAELMAEVVVSDDVVIDRRVTLKSAVIMPNTYISDCLEIRDAIVQGNLLIHVDTGAVTHVSDPLVLRRIFARESGRRMRSSCGRVGRQYLLPLLSLQRWLHLENGTTFNNLGRALDSAHSSANGSSSQVYAAANSVAALPGPGTLRRLASLFTAFWRRQSISRKVFLEGGEGEENGEKGKLTREDAEVARNESRKSARPDAFIAIDRRRRTETVKAFAVREEPQRDERGTILRRYESGVAQSGNLPARNDDDSVQASSLAWGAPDKR